MSNLENFLAFQYEVIEVMNEEKQISLVRDNISGYVYVQRRVSHEEGRVYDHLRGLGHNNLVGIIGVYPLEKECIIIEEYVSGMTLADYMNEHGLFSEEVAQEYICQLCGGLEVLHSHNLVHRNINPDNIVITTNGVLKLMNFGATRQYQTCKNQDTVLMGTAGYAAPEQFGFMASDARADIYATGVLLNKMLTGFLPMERLYKGKHAIEVIIKKCTQVDRNKRYSSVMEICKEFNRQKSGYYMQKFYELFPGLRSEQWYWKLCGFIGYSFFIWFFLGILQLSFEEFDTLKGDLAYAGVACIELLLPFVLAFNFGDYQVRILHLSAVPKPLRWLIGIGLAIVMFCFGLFLESALQGDFRQLL